MGLIGIYPASWQVRRDQRYFCFEAFQQMLRVQFRLGFLAAHATDGGDWRVLLKALLCAWGQSFDPAFPPRKWDETGCRGWCGKGGGSGILRQARTAGAGTQARALRKAGPGSPSPDHLKPSGCDKKGPLPKAPYAVAVDPYAATWCPGWLSFARGTCPPSTGGPSAHVA